MDNKCRVCGVKRCDWMHELSCREHNPLAWFFFDFIRARKDDIARNKAVSRYYEIVNAH